VDPAAGAAAPGQPTTFIGNATRFFQQVDFDNTYIAGNNTGNNLGITDTEVSATFAIPIFRNPFLVTPGFAAHFWNGPNSNGFNTAPALGPEMPPETYDAYLDTAWKPQITPRFSADLAVRVGMYTDFVYVTSRSLRTPGRALERCISIVFRSDYCRQAVPSGLLTPTVALNYFFLAPS
jgi:hypothetical protein